MMMLLGPLVLWWDGGGKGERFIQMVKPHIKRGICEDVLTFFVRLLEKLYAVSQLNLFEGRFGLSVDGQTDEDDDILDILKEIAEVLIPDSTQDDNKSDTGDDGSQTGNDDDDGDDSDTEPAGGLVDDSTQAPVNWDGKADTIDAHFTTNEVVGMAKKKTIYAYRNENQLNEAIAAGKPIAGIIEISDENQFEFQIVFRKPVKQFARRRLRFLDNDGVMVNGLWCAKIEVEDDESMESTGSFSDIQKSASLSAVAIPLWYVLGKEHPDALKYCVVTNYWKIRMSDGWYRLPMLDSSLYGGLQGEATDPLEDCELEFPFEQATAKGAKPILNQAGEI